MNVIDLPPEILCHILNYSNMPSDYFNINIVCRYFNMCNISLKETKAIQFRRKLVTHREIQKDEYYYNISCQSFVLPNGILHGIQRTTTHKRRRYQNFDPKPTIVIQNYKWNEIVE
jgi:hypothetical protein